MSTVPPFLSFSMDHARTHDEACALDEIEKPITRWERNIRNFVSQHRWTSRVQWQIQQRRFTKRALLCSLRTDCVFLEWTVRMFLRSRRKKTGYFGVKWSAHNIWFDIRFGKVSPFQWSLDRSQLRLKQSKIFLLNTHLHRLFVFSYTESKYLYVVYILIALHFLSGVAVSDRKFRHALGFAPHLLGLGYTSYLFYSNILHQLTPWIKVRHRSSRQEWMLRCFG